jgi:hypothetical protein
LLQLEWRPTNRRSPDQSVYYEISVGGALGETLRGAFPRLRVKIQRTETILAGELPDQAALFGVLDQIEALGLELLEVRRPHD